MSSLPVGNLFCKRMFRISGPDDAVPLTQRQCQSTDVNKKHTKSSHWPYPFFIQLTLLTEEACLCDACIRIYDCFAVI